jgi:hypothetical protein
MRDPIPYVLPYEYLKPMLSLSVKKRGLEIEESDGVETPLEPVQKKAKFKGEASKSAAISKWSGEEHDILTRMVDDQLELEKADDSQVISWTALWKKISSALHETGYERSWQACRVRWERFQEAEVKTTGLASDEVEPQVSPDFSEYYSFLWVGSRVCINGQLLLKHFTSENAWKEYANFDSLWDRFSL